MDFSNMINNLDKINSIAIIIMEILVTKIINNLQQVIQLKTNNLVIKIKIRMI